MSEDQHNLARRAKARSGPVEDYEDPDIDPEGPSDADLERFSDVTVVCKECGTELLDEVTECWKCGRAVGGQASHESGLPMWAVLTIVLVVVLMIGWAVL